MFRKSTLGITILTLLLSFSSFAGGGKLVDLLVNESGIVELLTNKKIYGMAQDKVKVYVKNSLMSLNSQDAMPTPRQIKKILGELTLSKDPADRRMAQKLFKSMGKDATSMDKQEVVSVVNDLIYLANRYGRRGSLILACAECVSDSLKKHGFKFTLEVIEDGAAKEILSSTLPRKPKELNDFLKFKMRSLGFGDFSRVKKGLVSKEEERALGLFLALAEKGSPATKVQREFIDSILSISTTPKGNIQLLDPTNPHKLWKLFDKDMDPKLMKEWTSLLNEVAEDGKGAASKRESFYAVLMRKAKEGDPSKVDMKIEQVKQMEAKGCYFP